MTNGANENVLFNFGSTSGVFPVGKLLSAENGKYYGLTKNGGVNNYGILYEYNSANGNFRKVADMNAIGGKYPDGSLIQTSNGNIYGTCSYGGPYSSNGYGILFEYNPVTDLIIKKYDFYLYTSQSNFYPYGGLYPKGNLLEGSNGKLYGVTSGGGIFDGQGSVYEYDRATNLYKNIVSFGTTDPSTSEGTPGPGKFPNGNIIFGSDGFIYGSTPTGGYGPKPQTLQDQRGTLFKVGLDGALSYFFSFSGSVLSGRPNGGVIEYNGKLYGTTSSGGSENSGELFEYNLISKVMVKRADFILSTTGGNPSGSLTLINEKLYGMTSLGGANGKGTIFEFDPTVGSLSKTFDFDGTNGQPGDNNQLLFQRINQAIIFESLPEKKTDDGTFLLSSTSSSGLDVTYFSSDPSVVSLSGNEVTILKAGSTTITAKQVGNENYNPATDVQQILTIAKATPVITWNNPSDIVFGNLLTSTQLNAFASVDGTFTYSPASGVRLNAGNAQSLAVTFTPANDAIYSTTTKQVLINVDKSSQYITFSVITDKTMGDAAIDLTASASSGLSVSYLSSDKVVINNAGQLTLINPGRVSVSAVQKGNSNYSAAAPVERSFCIKPAQPIVTIGNITTSSPSLTSSAPTGNQWFLDNHEIAGATSQTITANNKGTYKVQVKIEDCLSGFSADQVLVITGNVADDINSSILVFPNPAMDWIYVKKEDAKIKLVKIYELTGKEIDSKNVHEMEARFNITEYPSGVYMMKIQTEHAVEFIRFVKK